MTKIAIIADPHFENRSEFSRPWRPGVNTRLKVTGDAWLWAIDDILEKGITEIFVAGDIVHRHGVLTPGLLNYVRQCLHYRIDDRKLYLLSGNHDQDRHGNSCVSAFTGTNTYLADDATIHLLAGPLVDCVPYTSSLRSLAYSQSDLVIAHHHFEGAAHGPNRFVPDGGIEKLDKKIKKVLSGHYHLRQDLFGGRVTYVGSLIQQDFGEVGYKTGYSIWDFDQEALEYVDLPEHFPRFHTVPLSATEAPGNTEVDYYRVEVTPTTVGERPEELGLGQAKVRPAVVQVDKEVRSRVQDFLDASSDLVDLDTIMQVCVDMNEPDTVGAAELLAFGRDLVGQYNGS